MRKGIDKKFVLKKNTSFIYLSFNILGCIKPGHDQNICQTIEHERGQGTVVLGVSVRFVTLTWMRKVVGSNPGDGFYRYRLFSFVGIDCKKETDFAKKLEQQQCNAKQEEVRINLL